jgi:hypothetical protein
MEKWLLGRKRLALLEIVWVIDILLGLWFPLKRNHPIVRKELDEDNDEEVILRQVHPYFFLYI